MAIKDMKGTVSTTGMVNEKPVAKAPDMSAIKMPTASKEVVESYKRVTPAGKQFEITDNDCSVISYYDNGDKYDEHFDAFMHTAIIWFYKEPKKFEGGDFRLPELNETIECLHNRMIIFPSCYLHSVSPLKFKNKPFTNV